MLKRQAIIHVPDVPATIKVGTEHVRLKEFSKTELRAIAEEWKRKLYAAARSDAKRANVEPIARSAALDGPLL